MKKEKFVYTGVSVPELNWQEHGEFLMNVQRAVLFSLEKRELLTSSQRERCLAELERKFRV